MGDLVNNNRFTELLRLKLVKGYAEQQFFLSKKKFTLKGAWLADEGLYKFLKSNGTCPDYLSIDTGVSLVDKLFAQFILVDLLITEGLKRSTIKELSESLKEISKI